MTRNERKIWIDSLKSGDLVVVGSYVCKVSRVDGKLYANNREISVTGVLRKSDRHGMNGSIEPATPDRIAQWQANRLRSQLRYHSWNTSDVTDEQVLAIAKILNLSPDTEQRIVVSNG